MIQARMHKQTNAYVSVSVSVARDSMIVPRLANAVTIDGLRQNVVTRCVSIDVAEGPESTGVQNQEQ